MILKKSERERVEVAKRILKPFGISPNVVMGGHHKMLFVGSRKLAIATSAGGPKWEADVRRLACG